MTTLRSGLGDKGVHLAWGTADDVADVPRARVCLAISRIGQHQRMTCAVRGHRPGRRARVRHRQQHGPLFISNSSVSVFLNVPV